MLNRAPSLHRLSIQSFKIRLTNEKVIRLHPLTCAGFNADFDGDQMAAHIPLSLEAKLEALLLMMSNKNILHPAHGGPSILPSQDIILGLYYLSLVSTGYSNTCFGSYIEVSNALLNGKIKLYENIKFHKLCNGIVNIVNTTPGRLLIDEIIPKKCGITYDITMPNLSKNNINSLIEFVYKTCSETEVLGFCENLMRLGFKYASMSGISLSMKELCLPYNKSLVLRDMNMIMERSIVGDMISTSEDYERYLEARNNVLNRIYLDVDIVMDNATDKQTSIQIMLNSGARGTLSQVRQLIGAKGQITNFDGSLDRFPILNSYSDGLLMNEFYKSTYSARKGMIDTVLNTASSGYLTRKLVEVCRDYVIKEVDCFCKGGIDVPVFYEWGYLKCRLLGRVLAKAVFVGDKIIINANTLIDEFNIFTILRSSQDSINIRSPITCLTDCGVCCMCYGVNIGSNTMVTVGDSIGVLAAQSVGEPGTQFTLRTFHGLGLFGNVKDSVVFGRHLTSPCFGLVKIVNMSCVCLDFGDMVIVNNNCVLSIYSGDIVVWFYNIPRGMRLMIQNNTVVEPGVVIGVYYSSRECCISLIGGVLKFRNLIKDINMCKLVDLKTGLREFIVDTGKSKLLSALVLIYGGFGLLYNFNIVRFNKIVLGSGSIVRSFDQVLIDGMFSSLFPFSSIGKYDIEGDMIRLAKLFENSISSKYMVLAPFNGTIRSCCKLNNKGVYILEPDDFKFMPVVYNVGLNNYFRTARIESGDLIAGGDIDLSNYIKSYGLNKFVNYFMDKVYSIYECQGVSVDSKHIEVILRLMTNNVIVTDPGISSFKKGWEFNWRAILAENVRICENSRCIIKYEWKLSGIDDLIINGPPLLSSISYQGSVKSIIKAMLVNKYQSLGIKDNIILGRLAPIGAGMYR